MSNNKEFSSEKSSSVKNVLIIGATGYIGGALCRKFSQTQDFAVLALVRSSSDIEGIKPFCKEIIRSQEVEISSNDVAQAIRNHDITTVINVAWHMPPESTKEAQFAKDRIALEAALHGAKAVSPDIHVITTSGNFSLITANGGQITEIPPPKGYTRPEYLVCLDLLVGVNVLKDGLIEEYISNGGNASIVYPSSVYGSAPTRGSFWDFAIQQFITGKPHQGYQPFPQDFMTAWIHVEDLADCYIAVTRFGSKGGYYLAAPENFSISQVSKMFAQAAQVEFLAPVFENKDKVIFDDSHTKELLQLQWKYKVADEVKGWVERIKELGTYFLE
ncbi:NAD-dependent epimerase/dehydratase family protein [Nostoc sp. 'Lobaria pulmonaria (5183) cyanobiont']|uniref:NAD-dependent epimerase/dehydratase family protein n=1 Tax=Nostoc sp. 'Lobaria pulmonaria (5183) cyanobiont' TaxID=1618022 RepID=UPI000CF33522|nr:NAD-dependent epimerase/dehydratase family protein [Nostoc sp. 'Lobaria pulmonaria (5183) cyanobiont']AVH70638.1 NAD-dependent epimerase/dehydratase [Nostoc sp. 'Lobaria pulmonaria (5183) cyanobiont']